MGGDESRKHMPRKPIKLCKEKNCKNEQTTMGYCRLHYLRNWKKIREQHKKKAAESLNKYIDHIMKRNPDNYIEAIKGDLRHAGRFQEKADGYFVDDSYSDAIEGTDLSEQVEHIVDSLKVDTDY